MSHFRWQAGDTLILNCHIQPNARENSLSGLHGDALKIRLHAPPVDGKANQQLIDFLSVLFAVPKSQIALLRGQASRRKTVSIIQPQKLPPESLVTLNK